MNFKTRKNLTSSLGNIVEFYDFALYGYFADYIGKAFFPDAVFGNSLLASFATFSIGFLTRPFGGAIFGMLGDKKGRALVLKIVYPIMLLATLSIAMIPSYSEIGIAAPILLLIARALQGMSAGGQSSSSITMLGEDSHPSKLGLSVSMAWSFSNVGFIIASLVGVIIVTLSDNSPNAWRYVFMSTIILIPAVIWICRNISESKEFALIASKSNHQNNRVSIWDLVKFYPVQLLKSIVIAGTQLVVFYTLFAYGITYFKIYGGFSQNESLLLNAVAMIIMTVFIPLIAMLGDRIGHVRVVRWGVAALTISVFPMAYTVVHHYEALSWLLMIILSIISTFFMAPVLAIMITSFPTQFRLRGMGISFNIGAALIGGTSPLVTTWMIDMTTPQFGFAGYLLLWVVLALFALSKSSPKYAHLADEKSAIAE